MNRLQLGNARQVKPVVQTIARKTWRAIPTQKQQLTSDAIPHRLSAGPRFNTAVPPLFCPKISLVA
jgi:hypothetical protein